MRTYVFMCEFFHPLCQIFDGTEEQGRWTPIGWESGRHHDHFVSLVDDAAFTRNAQSSQHVVPCDVTLRAVNMLYFMTSACCIL